MRVCFARNRLRGRSCLESVHAAPRATRRGCERELRGDITQHAGAVLPRLAKTGVGAAPQTHDRACAKGTALGISPNPGFPVCLYKTDTFRSHSKYLLHHRPCVSPLPEFGPKTRFRAVIADGDRGDNLNTGNTTSGTGTTVNTGTTASGTSDPAAPLGHRKIIPTQTPYKIYPPKYTKEPQYADQPDTTDPLDKKGTTRVQAIVGSILYYARAIEHPMLPSLNEISREQAKPTSKTSIKIDNLLHYAATFPDAVIQINASDMIMHVDSDAAYLVLPNAKSRIAGYYYFSDKDGTYINAPFHIVCKTLKNVVSSAAEAETGGLFINGQEIIPLRYILEQIGHPQPPTPLKTDNSTSNGFVHKNIKIKKSKAWDMRYHWLREKIAQQNLRIFWDRGVRNYADYYTKHHITSVHKEMRPFIFKANIILQKCEQLARVC